MAFSSVLRAAFPGALLLFSLTATNSQGQAPVSSSPVPAPSSNATGTSTVPLWAYPILPSSTPGWLGPKPTAVPDEIPHHVPGSSQTYTTADIADHFAVADWFPNDHPPMPTPVAKGRKPTPYAYACGYCHLPNGLGRPENQSLAGLPKEYIVEQVRSFRDGSRRTSEPRMYAVNMMDAVAKAVTPEEVTTAADYFTKLKLTKWISVVETDTVPKTHVAGGMFVADANGSEPIGSRIVEVPKDYEQAELRNSESGFIAYVPKGSLKTGEALVKTGSGATGGEAKTIACTTCHGPDLHGVGNIPGIAGRSPSQMARQLIDFRNGTRNGPLAALMKLPVSKLTDDDIVAITAYLASLEP